MFLLLLFLWFGLWFVLAFTEKLYLCWFLSLILWPYQWLRLYFTLLFRWYIYNIFKVFSVLSFPVVDIKCIFFIQVLIQVKDDWLITQEVKYFTVIHLQISIVLVCCNLFKLVNPKFVKLIFIYQMLFIFLLVFLNPWKNIFENILRII